MDGCASFCRVITLFASSFILSALSFTHADVLDSWRVAKIDLDYIGFTHKEDGATFNCVRLISDQKTTKKVAQVLSKEVHGFELKAVLPVKGWQFSFITDRTCTALVTRKNTGFEYMWGCGEIEANDLKELIKISRLELDKYRNPS